MEEIHSSHGKAVDGLSTSSVVGTSITHCAAMEGKGKWSLTAKKSWSMDTILRQEPSISSMDAGGMDVLAWDPIIVSTRELWT